ncbi:MAG TPA: DUF4214 domain-containing protein [Pyrinomonadaceae bacterium]|jgi:hypothetical protein|nr:DUF4214 domain-containing protein [Pyrinomonadaceae bacterium]
MKNRKSGLVRIIHQIFRRNSSLGIGLAVFVFALSLIAVSADGGSGSGNGDVISQIEANLAGAAINGLIPRGEAEAKTFVNGNRKFEVHVTNVNLPDNTVLAVSVDGAQAGSLRLVGLRGEFEVETEDGESVPPVNSRTRVVVSSAAGDTIVAGSFSNASPSPTPTPGASPSPTPTPGATPSPTPTPGASPSPTPTPGATPTPSPSPNPNETRLESRLAGAAINGLLPKGQARFRSRSTTRRELEVEVEKVKLPAGTVLNVLIDNANVGQLHLNSNLEDELELETEHGAIVPNVTSTSTVVVTNAQGATILSGVFNTRVSSISGNDIDDSRYFVEQHYRDFFDREADDSGLDFWERQIANCGDDSRCREGARTNTSGAFFLSIEFQETGFLLYRFYKASFGTMPRRNDFIVEMQALAQGLVVGQTGWQQKLEDNKRVAAERWANRVDFHARYDGKSNSQFVDELFANAGVTPGQQERQTLINGLNSALDTRGSVLRKVAENAELARREKNPAFVLMQYFGYLHRNPDEGPDHDFSGFNFWLHKLDDNGGDFHRAEMVKAFLVAGEYRDRFVW